MPSHGTIQLAIAAALLLPADAVAQEFAIPDPDSPAGVEYQLPLERARDIASAAGDSERPGGRSSDGPSTSSPPLFGQGIRRERNGEARDSARSSRPNREGEAPGSSLSSEGYARITGNEGSASTRPISTAGSGSSGLLLPGIILAVLLLGGALGLGLRRGLGGERQG